MKIQGRWLVFVGLANFFLGACSGNATGRGDGSSGTNSGGSQAASAGAAGTGGGLPSAGSSADAQSGGAGAAQLGGGAAGGDSGASGAAASGAGSGGAPAVGGVERWHPTDVIFGGTSASQLTDSISATFSGPAGENLVVPGFFDGAQGWKVRFAPTAEGSWTYTTTSSIPALNGKTGSLQCVPNTNARVHGRVLVDRAHPHYFKYEDGTPYVLMGFEADWLGLLDFGDTKIPRAKALVDLYASQGFNHVLMNVFAYDTNWRSGKTSADDYGPPASYPWQGSNAKPDQTQLNPSFFASYDRVISYLLDHGVVAHIMLKVYNKAVNWPAKGSPEDDLYFKYVLARYQAYPNVVWDFSKESNNETDVAYKSGRIKLMHDQDGYHHPVSTHTDTGYYASAASKGLLDFRTDQNQSAFYDTIISHRNADAWPVINSEYGYQLGNDGGKTYGFASDARSVFEAACEVAMAGGHFVYYYTYHAWDVVRPSEVPNGLSAYANLHALLMLTKWSELTAADNLIDNPGNGRHCLAQAGAEYLVYLSKQGTATLDVAQLPAGTKVQGKWLNLVTGVEQALGPVGNGPVALTSPWPEPAVAHLAP